MTKFFHWLSSISKPAKRVEADNQPVAAPKNIRPIAARIIQDLEDNDPDVISVKEIKPRRDWDDPIAITNIVKKYTIVITWTRFKGFSVYLKGLSSFDFNSDETQAIIKTWTNLNDKKTQAKDKIQAAKDETKLRKMFPECYK